MGLNLGENTLADNLLKYQRNGDDDGGLHRAQRLGNDGGRGQTVQEVDVHAVGKAEKKLYRQTVHVGHRKNGEHIGAALHLGGQLTQDVVGVAPQRTVGKHHTLGMTRGAARVVDHGQLLRLVLVVVHVLGTEGHGIFLAEHLVQVGTAVSESLGARYTHRQVGQVDDAHQVGHGVGSNLLGHKVAHKQYLRSAVVHDVVYLLAVELMKDGNGHGTIGEGGQKGYAPVRTVTAAHGYLVALLYPYVFIHDMYLGYLACHIIVLQGSALIIGQGVVVPVFYNAVFYEFVEAG